MTAFGAVGAVHRNLPPDVEFQKILAERIAGENDSRDRRWRHRAAGATDRVIVQRHDGGTANGGADSVTQTFTITVDTTPVANDDQASADKGVTCLHLNRLTNHSDADGDALSAIIASDRIGEELFDASNAYSLGVKVVTGSTTSAIGRSRDSFTAPISSRTRPTITAAG